MEVKEDPRPERMFRITLSERELRLLAGVLDFPVWSDQPDDVRRFCHTTYSACIEALGVDSLELRAVDVGMVPGRVSVDATDV